MPTAGEGAPKELDALLERVYQSCLKERGGDSDRDKQYCSGVAWKAAKYSWKNENGKWVKKKKEGFMDYEIEIFRAGNYPEHGGEWGADVVADAVESYDPSIHPAPCVIGHPKDDDPAYAWVEGLRATDDGRLFARVDESTALPGFLDMISGGIPEAGGWKPFRKVSAKFYRPDDPYNPNPGHVSLRHVGFLGGEVPAVKGMDTTLRPVSFADDGSTAVGPEFDFVPGKPFKEAKKMSVLDRLLAVVGKLSPDGNVTPEFKEAFAEQFGVPFDEAIREPEPDNSAGDSTGANELKADYEKKIKAAEARIAELEEGRKADIEAQRENRIQEFVERMTNDGKVPPAMRDKMVAMLGQIEPGTTEVGFSEGNKENIENLSLAFRFLDEMLGDKYNFNEIAGEGRDPETKDAASVGLSIASKASSFKEQGGGGLKELAALIAEEIKKSK